MMASRSQMPFLSRLQTWSKTHALEPKVQAQAKGDSLSLSIYGPIGSFEFDSVTDKQVARALEDNDPSEIDLAINSPGGDAFMGVAIYNLLKEHRAHVTVRILGEASSAAGIISQAGDRIVMGTGAMMMIHNAWTIALGNWREFRTTMNALKKLDSSQADILSSRSNLTRDRALSYMERETYFTADEAISFGLADEKADGSTHVEDLQTEEDVLEEDATPEPKAEARRITTLDREGLNSLGSLFHL